MKNINKSKQDILDELCAKLESGSASAWVQQAAAETIRRSSKIGRPKGTTSSLKTPSYLRAQDYLYLIADGSSSVKAIKSVSQKWNLSANTIYQDIKRHAQKVFAAQMNEANHAEQSYFSSLIRSYTYRYLTLKLENKNSSSLEKQINELAYEFVRKMLIDMNASPKRKNECSDFISENLVDESNKELMVKIGISVFTRIELSLNQSLLIPTESLVKDVK